ncbi:MAG: conjugal transfer protein TraX [Lachnospiraceae bacterium]|nr:conjugal transfer protein TraX [Lachnospiraceae bacterium]
MKIIAVIAMVIDHIGLGIWYRLPELGYLVPETIDAETWWSVYRLMRNIGRTAFPIFCFLLVEGFFHTRSYAKYALRLFTFAFISQLPFRYALLDLAKGLNVFFTLFIGLVTIWVLAEVKIRWPKRFIYLPGWVLIITIACYLAYLLDTDYDYKGVLLIVVLYIFHKTRLIALISGYLSFKVAMYYSSAMSLSFLKYMGADYYFPGFILSYIYNGRRGLKTKYLFYLIYPVHLAIIYMIWNYLL